MSATKDRFVERVGVPDLTAPLFTAGDASVSTEMSASAVTSEIVDMQNLNKIVVTIKQAGTNATGSLKIEASTSTAGSDFTTLVGHIGTNTAGSATATVTPGQYQEIEVHASALRASNYQYVRAITTVDLDGTAAYALTDMDIQVSEGAYGNIRSTDMYEYKSSNATDIQTPMYVH